MMTMILAALVAWLHFDAGTGYSAVWLQPPHAVAGLSLAHGQLQAWAEYYLPAWHSRAQVYHAFSGRMIAGDALMAFAVALTAGAVAWLMAAWPERDRRDTP